MTRFGDVEDIRQEYGPCIYCGKVGDLANGACRRCWDKGLGSAAKRNPGRVSPGGKILGGEND